MPSDDSDLGTFTDSFEPRHLSHSVTSYKHGSFILEGLSGNGNSSFCMDIMVHMQRKKQQSI